MLINLIKNVRIYKIQILSAFIAALGMLSDGMQFAWSSPAVPKLTADDSVIRISKTEAMWVSQFYLVGNIAGVPLSFIVFRNMGRKSSILLACVAINLAWLGNITARSALMLYLSRFIGGIGKHMIFVSVPMYIGEMADPKIRGILGTFIYMMVQLGSLIIYSVTPFYPLYVSCLVGLFAALVPLMTIKFLPESPYYLLKKGDMTRAKESLQILRGTDDVMAEFKELDIAVKRQMAVNGSFLQLFTDHNNLKALAILVFLRISQAMTGVAVIIMNVHTIFEEVGDHISPDTSAIIYAFLMFTSTIFTVGIMDQFGRKSLMIFSSIVTALALSLIGAFFYLKLSAGFNTDLIYWLPITCTCLFVYGYRIGLGTVPIIMVGELLNVNVKVPGVVISDLAMSISSFTANLIFQYTEEMYGMYVPFWIFATCCIVCAVFSVLFVPETRKKSLEEIQFIIMNKNENCDKKDDLDKIETSPV